MRPGGGHAKGAGFERKCCKLLSLWVTKGKRQDCFWRTAMSGGRATVAHRRSIKQSEAAGRPWPGVPAVRQAGDITAVSEEGLALTARYVIECKFYNDFNMDRFILENKGKLAGFWLEVCKLARRYRKQPMLIAKRNGYPAFVVVGTEENPRLLLFSALLKQPPPK